MESVHFTTIPKYFHHHFKMYVKIRGSRSKFILENEGPFS